MADRNAIEIGIGLRADDSQLAGDLARIKSKVEGTPIKEGVSDAASDVKKKTDEATKSVEKLGEETKKAGKKGKEALDEGGLGGTLRAAKKKFGEQVEVVQGLIGKFAAIGAIATTFYAIGRVIGEQIVDRLTTAKEKASDFLLTIDRSDTKNAIKQISGEVQNLNVQIAEADSLGNQFAEFLKNLEFPIVSDIAAFFTPNIKEVEDRKAILITALKGISNDAAKAVRQSQISPTKDFYDQINAINRENATDEQKIALESEEKKMALRQAFSKLDADAQKKNIEELQRQLQRIDEQTQQKINAKREADQAENLERIRREADEWQEAQEKLQDFNDGMKKWAREQQEAADKVRNDWVKSLQDIRQEINATFGQESANSLTQFSQQLQVQTMQTVGNFNRIITEGVG